MENKINDYEKLEDSSLEEVSGGRGFDDLVARGNQAQSSTLEFRGSSGGVRFLGRTWFFPWRRKDVRSVKIRKSDNGGSSSETTVDL